MVEGRHFRRDWASAADIGHRAAAQNLSDINAMGGRATSLTVGLAAPPTCRGSWALDFARGFAEECALVGASVVGGDLTRADQVVIAVTVLGRVHGGARASGPEPRPGDVVALAAGRAGRPAGWPCWGAASARRGCWSRPTGAPSRRTTRAQVAAEAGATAMIDVSDGLLADVGHIADARRVSRSTCTAPRSSSPSRCRPSAPPSARTRSSSSSAAATTTPCSPTFPDGIGARGVAGDRHGRPRAPGVTVDGAAYDGPTGWTHF